MSEQATEIEPMRVAEERGTVSVGAVFANGPTGDLRITITDPIHGDSLTGYIHAADVSSHLRSALGLGGSDDA